MKRKQNTIGYSLRMPKDWDIMDDWETKVRKCKNHNNLLFNEHNENLKRAKKTMQEITVKLMQSTKIPLAKKEYEKLERQLNQIKSGYLFALTHEFDPGCAINGEADTAVRNAYNNVTKYWRDAITIIDQHLITLEGIVKRDAKKTEPKYSKQYQILRDCFFTDDEYKKAIAILQNTTPCVIDKNMNYKAGERNKAAITEWVNYLKYSTEITIALPEQKILVSLLNKAFAGLNMGAHGRTLENVSNKWRLKIEKAK